MYCSACGHENSDDARFCESCGRETRGLAAANPPSAPAPYSRQSSGGYSSSGIGEPRDHVPNHLVWAILVTIFCCLPFGIVAIVYAAQVNGMLNAGDYEGARRASNSAKTWAIVSMALGLIGVGIWILLNLLNIWSLMAL